MKINRDTTMMTTDEIYALDMEEARDEAQAMLAIVEERLATVEKARDHFQNLAAERGSRADLLHELLELREQQIIELKAELYDLLKDTR